jgi:hypothetical protein
VPDLQGYVLPGQASGLETALHSARDANSERVVASFNGKFREYCLDLNWFASLEELV